jgi:D-alanyl-D-alanine carboxypeptidase (penicillin-binding protein 5/6)
MFRSLLVLLFAAAIPALASPEAAQSPPAPPVVVPPPAVPAPAVAAAAFLLVDVTSGQTLTAANADERRDPASLTKLMTAYLVFGALRA